MGEYNKDDRIKNSYYLDDPISGQTTKRVKDPEAKAVLDAILAALGGSTDTTPDIQNINIVAVNTEQSYVLPANTKRFLIRSRNKGKLRLAYGATETTTKYITVPAGSSFTDPNLYQSQTIYFQSAKAGDVVELVVYT